MGERICGETYKMNIGYLLERIANIVTPVNILHVIYILLAISLVIVIHEFGHYAAAKLIGVYVEKFSLGFGPVIIKIKRETEFLISLIPLGGYVKMKGEHPFEKKETSSDGFFSKTPLQRIFVVTAGPAGNFFLGFFILFITTWAGGKLIMQNLSKAGDIIPGSAAESAGLSQGDSIIAINGHPMEKWDDLVSAIHPNAGKELLFLIERDGKRFTKKMTPQLEKQTGVGLIGITAPYTRASIPPHRAFITAADRSAGIVILTAKFLILTIAGKVKAEVTGPVGIASIMKDKIQQGWIAFFELVALLSLNLGLINLFPIPILDGGHVVIFTWESITKKFPSEKAYGIMQTIGLAFLILIMVAATRSDLLRIFG
ncbi:RIP metalloprotease RseP [bacterium]|nr:RIP metalloprotease RseP [bacterium]MBU3956303.1 RIP metalloprotease RseP [bacterium]MBU4133708.1 RIP metalloprotease RseP [bacterium]